MGKMQNCGSFSALLSLVMSLLLSSPNTFSTHLEVIIIKYGSPMMKGWRIIKL